MAKPLIIEDVHWTPEELASPGADVKLNQRSWEQASDEFRARTGRVEWKRFGPGGYERWRRFVWLDDEIEIVAPSQI